MTIAIAAYSNSQTVSTTERSIPNNADFGSGLAVAVVGIFQALIDLTPLAAGDVFEFRLYEKAIADGVQRLMFSQQFANAQADPLWTSPPLTLGLGWDMTLKKIAGIDRVIDARIAKIS